MSAFIKNAQYSNDGIDVLRATQQDQVQLNMMADQKANIVIGVTLIFFTLTQRQLVSGMGEYELLILPLITLATAMFGSFVLSVLVVAPKMRRTRRCKPEEMANPLFFGAFQGVSEDEFAAYLLNEVREVDRSREFVIRDIHQAGRVLHRKYRFLQLSYI